MFWKTSRKTLDLSHRGRIMGILNVTPDSFSDGGCWLAPEAAVGHALEMAAAGADIIDIGGESTRPGAAPVAAATEIARVIPVVRALREQWDGWISVDTSKAAVAAAALAAGADIVNDVTGLRGDPAMAGLCAATGCAAVVMHMQGEPRTMQVAPEYRDVVADVAAFFQERFDTLTAAGLDPLTLCFDPGIGFGKTTAHNLTLLRALDRLAPAGRPLLLGISRKSMLGEILGGVPPAGRAWATVALTAWTREAGVRLHRVHDVKANVDALRMTEAMLGVDCL